MQRPLLELAAIVGAAGHRFLDRPPAWFTWLHVKILVAIEQCRTAAMGGHLDQRSSCGQQAISYNSCRNRHCPKCQSQPLWEMSSDVLRCPPLWEIVTQQTATVDNFAWRRSSCGRP